MTKANETINNQETTFKIEWDKVLVSYVIDGETRPALYFISNTEHTAKITSYLESKKHCIALVISQMKIAWLLKSWSDMKEEIQNELLTQFA